MQTKTLMQLEILGNSGKHILVAAAIFIIVMFVFILFQKYLIQRFKKLVTKTQLELDDLIIESLLKIRPSFYFFASLFLSTQYLELPPIMDYTIDGLFLIVVVYQIVFTTQNLIHYAAKKIILSTQEKKDETKEQQKRNRTPVQYISTIINIFVWILAFLIVLSNFGINVTSLIAGLGVGGIAVALAAQSLLGDVFSSFVIIFDKPFAVGDYIKVGGDSGVVEKIGIKSTRIKTLQGEQLIISNKELTTSRVNNFKKLKERRVTFILGIAYEISNTKLRKVPNIVKKIIKEQNSARFDRCHFKEFGEFSLNFEVVYRIKSDSYEDYVEEEHAVNSAIKQHIEDEDIDFAYPTHTVYMKQ